MPSAFGLVVQLNRTSDSGSEGRGFESLLGHIPDSAVADNQSHTALFIIICTTNAPLVINRPSVNQYPIYYLLLIIRGSPVQSWVALQTKYLVIKHLHLTKCDCFFIAPILCQVIHCNLSLLSFVLLEV